MATNKTVETNASVAAYIEAIADEKKREDFRKLVATFEEVTKLPPKMWGPSIVGFGSYHYKYESGREGDAPLTGLSARVNAFTLYLGSNFEHKEDLLQQFGKHSLSKGCIYIKKLEDIKLDVLKKMIEQSVTRPHEGEHSC